MTACLDLSDLFYRVFVVVVLFLSRPDLEHFVDHQGNTCVPDPRDESDRMPRPLRPILPCFCCFCFVLFLSRPDLEHFEDHVGSTCLTPEMRVTACLDLSDVFYHVFVVVVLFLSRPDLEHFVDHQGNTCMPDYEE